MRVINLNIGRAIGLIKSCLHFNVFTATSDSVPSSFFQKAA